MGVCVTKVFTKLPSGGESWSVGALQEVEAQASCALLHSAVMFSWDWFQAPFASGTSRYQECRWDLIGQVYPFNNSDSPEISFAGLW